MATRNTRITGLQIKDATVELAKLSAAVQSSLGLADSALQSIAAGSITETELNVSVNASLDLADSALQSIGAGSITETELNVSVNASLDKADSAIQTELDPVFTAALDTDNTLAADSDTKVASQKAIKYYVDNKSDIGFPKTDLIANEVPTGLINSSNVDYDVANTPATGTLQVFLNGLQQEPGSGNDYTLSGVTITFAVAPETGDILIVNYCK